MEIEDTEGQTIFWNLNKVMDAIDVHIEGLARTYSCEYICFALAIVVSTWWYSFGVVIEEALREFEDKLVFQRF